MGIEPTAGGCPATGFEVQERHQAANYSLNNTGWDKPKQLQNFKICSGNYLLDKSYLLHIDYTIICLFAKHIMFPIDNQVKHPLYPGIAIEFLLHQKPGQ